MKDAMRQKFGANEKASEGLSRLKNAHHFQRLSKVLDENKKFIAYGGGRDAKELYIQPTIISNADTATPIMRDEVFGPILTVFPVDDVQRDAVRVIQSYPKPLMLRVYSDDPKFVDDIVARTDSGGVGVNTASTHFTTPGFPFGGSGNSGCGTYHGKYSFLAFSHEKPVLRAKL